MKRIVLFVLFVAAAAVMAACAGQPSASQSYNSSTATAQAVARMSQTPTPSQTPTATEVDVESMVATQVAATLEKVSTATPVATETKTPVASATGVSTATQVAATARPTAEVSAKALEESTCPLKDKGVQVDFEKVPDTEGFYNLGASMKELQPYVGCNVLIEGRKVLIEEHHIWLFHDETWTLKVREASLWVYPSDWNMDDFGAEKAPIATEFVVAKRNNQLENGYDWKIFVHTLTGNSVMFPAGSTMPAVDLPDNAAFDDPEPIEIHGVWDGKAFDASIGGEKTITVALLDGTLYWWKNAKDNVLYKSVEAYTMPSAWSQDQIEAWCKEKFPTKELLPYVPAD